MQNIYAKANNTLSLLRRNMGSWPRKTKERCYATLVRPTIEYSSTVWDPYTSKNIDKLETIQRRVARFVNSNCSWYASQSNVIADLGWESLAERRAKAKVAMTYAIMNGLVDIPKTKFTESTCTKTRDQHDFINHCSFTCK